MAVLNTKPYLKYILKASLQGSPREDITYPVIVEFISEHKNPPDRFAIYPQISLRWQPLIQTDTRVEVPDFALGNFTIDKPYFKIRVGAEAKRIVDPDMTLLPDPQSLQHNEMVMLVFHWLYYQGEDQAKAAIRGGMTFSNSVPYFLFVGPYWMSVRYGPFTLGQLSVRTLKRSPSGDYSESMMAARRLEADPEKRPIFLLGTAESSIELERVIASTDDAARALRAEAALYTSYFLHKDHITLSLLQPIPIM